MNDQRIHYSKYYHRVHFINTPVRHPYPSSAQSSGLSAFPGHGHITPASTEALITLKGSPPPHVSLTGRTHYWNYQVPSHNLPARESRWTWETATAEAFYCNAPQNLQCKSGEVLSRCALVSTLDDTDVNRLRIYNLLKECQSALMHHFEMYHLSVLNNKYSSGFRSCEAAKTENTAEDFCRVLWVSENDAEELMYSSHGGRKEKCFYTCLYVSGIWLHLGSSVTHPQLTQRTPINWG